MMQVCKHGISFDPDLVEQPTCTKCAEHWKTVEAQEEELRQMLAPLLSRVRELKAKEQNQ